METLGRVAPALQKDRAPAACAVRPKQPWAIGARPRVSMEGWAVGFLTAQRRDVQSTDETLLEGKNVL